MGLDQYFFAAPADSYNKEVDFEPLGSHLEVAYWRKHNALHGWMEGLYRLKGGKSPEMCAEGVNLTLADLAALERAVVSGSLPVTGGFFFGADSSKDPSRKDEDVAAINKAREMISNGLKVYYTSSW